MADHSFPRCFGPKENEPIDPSASLKSFTELQHRIEEETEKAMPLDAMVSHPPTGLTVDLWVRQDRE